MPDSSELKIFVTGLAGAAIGGLVGYWAFIWVANQGFYVLMLPAALLGLGAGLAARQRSQLLAAICGVAGLLVGLFCEWRLFPFVADGSLSYFLTHVHQLKPFTLLLIALGTFFSYRFALGR